MEEEVLTDIPSEGQLIAPLEDTEAPAESSPEVQPEEQPSSGEDVKSVPEGFHNDPKAQEYIQRQVEIRSAKDREELLKEIESIKTQVAPQPEVQMAPWFVAVAGDSPEAQKAWKLYEAQTQAEKSQWKQEFMAEQQAEVAKQQAVQTEAETHINSQVVEMKSEGKTFDENALRKFLWDYTQEYGSYPSTPDGKLDMRKGLKLMQALTPSSNEKSEARQQVAAAAGVSLKGEATEPLKLTRKDINFD